MAMYCNLIWLLCVSVVINKVYGRSISMRKDLRMKRCGVNDVNITWNKSRHSRSLRTYWVKNPITYEVLNKPNVSWFWPIPEVSQERVEELARKAFAEWAPHCGLRFERRQAGSGPRADITISFERGEHGDGSPFDGPGWELAHAVYRTGETVDIHFDDDEYWIDGVMSGTEDENKIENIYPVLQHEIGHALGLPHSHDQNSIMYDHIKTTHLKRNLSASDILNMREFYGEEAPGSSRGTRCRFSGESFEDRAAMAEDDFSFLPEELTFSELVTNIMGIQELDNVSEQFSTEGYSQHTSTIDSEDK